MIKATKAVRKENSEKIDYERFESLLEDMDISEYSKIADELFVVFECIDDDGESSFELEDRVIYLIVRIPYQKMLKSSVPFKLLNEGFLASLETLSAILDVERLVKDCTDRVKKPIG